MSPARRERRDATHLLRKLVVVVVFVALWWMLYSTTSSAASTAFPLQKQLQLLGSPDVMRVPQTAFNRTFNTSELVMCVRRFMLLSESTSRRYALPRRELPHYDIPLMVLPVMNDASHLHRMLCSIDVPVQYFFMVLNGNEPLALNLATTLEEEIGSSGRFILHHSHHNLGYAGSMNAGMRWGLRKRNDEVPWMFLVNCDVAFGGDVMAALVQTMAVVTEQDAAVMEKLQREVDAETRPGATNPWAPAGRPLKVLRSGHPNVPPEVETSVLLPDRLRYRHADQSNPQRRPAISQPFAGHYGTITPVADAQPAVAVTRLMVSTTGLMDENFYPAYMEDIDWRWRMSFLGFDRAYIHSYNNNSIYFYHFNGGNNRAYDKHDHNMALQEGVSNYLRQVGQKRKYYQLAKYGKISSKVWGSAPDRQQNKYLFFNTPDFPVDVWVRDPDHHACFFERAFNYTTKTWSFPPRCMYNKCVLLTAGVLGTQQSSSMPECIHR